MGDQSLIASVKLEQVKYGRSAINCASLVSSRPALAMLIEQVVSRLAGTCDVNRASGQSVGRHLRC